VTTSPVPMRWGQIERRGPGMAPVAGTRARRGGRGTGRQCPWYMNGRLGRQSRAIDATGVSLLNQRS
jgi:hypothetical protein